MKKLIVYGLLIFVFVSLAVAADEFKIKTDAELYDLSTSGSSAEITAYWISRIVSIDTKPLTNYEVQLLDSLVDPYNIPLTVVFRKDKDLVNKLPRLATHFFTVDQAAHTNIHLNFEAAKLFFDKESNIVSTPRDTLAFFMTTASGRGNDNDGAIIQIGDDLIRANIEIDGNRVRNGDDVWLELTQFGPQDTIVFNKDGGFRIITAIPGIGFDENGDFQRIWSSTTATLTGTPPEDFQLTRDRDTGQFSLNGRLIDFESSATVDFTFNQNYFSVFSLDNKPFSIKIGNRYFGSEAAKFYLQNNKINRISATGDFTFGNEYKFIGTSCDLSIDEDRDLVKSAKIKNPELDPGRRSLDESKFIYHPDDNNLYYVSGRLPSQEITLNLVDRVDTSPEINEVYLRTGIAGSHFRANGHVSIEKTKGINLIYHYLGNRGTTSQMESIDDEYVLNSENTEMNNAGNLINQRIASLKVDCNPFVEIERRNGEELVTIMDSRLSEDSPKFSILYSSADKDKLLLTFDKNTGFKYMEYQDGDLSGKQIAATPAVKTRTTQTPAPAAPAARQANPAKVRQVVRATATAVDIRSLAIMDISSNLSSQ